MISAAPRARMKYQESGSNTQLLRRGVLPVRRNPSQERTSRAGRRACAAAGSQGNAHILCQPSSFLPLSPSASSLVCAGRVESSQARSGGNRCLQPISWKPIKKNIKKKKISQKCCNTLAAPASGALLRWNTSTPRRGLQHRTKQPFALGTVLTTATAPCMLGALPSLPSLPLQG